LELLLLDLEVPAASQRVELSAEGSGERVAGGPLRVADIG
jgi:hypothetical protein